MNPKVSNDEWLRYVRTADDYFRLLTTLQGIPSNWIHWVEKQTLAAERRGIIIENQLAYRLTALWNGIVYLQESKFICDTIENALRKSFTEFAISNQVAYKELTFPNWKRIQKTIAHDFSEVVSQSDVILCFYFPDLYGIIINNWDAIPEKYKRIPGFKKMFGANIECRDVNKFKCDMKRVHNERNEIAHSKKLFKPDEAQQLYRIANLWLRPLGVEIKERILAYRSKRPKFLDDVKLV